MLATSTAAARPAVLPLFAAAPAPDNGFGAFSCRNRARAPARPGPRPRQPGAAFGDGGGLRRLGCRGRLGLEGCLRSRRGGAGVVPAQIRPCHANPRRLRHRDARDADPARRAAAVADPPLGGKQPLPAILDADRVGSRRRRSRCNHRGRSRPRTLGRDGPVGDFRRTGRRRSRAERDRRHPRRVARPPLPRLRRHPAQRRAHQRSARSGGAPQRRADEPALLIVAACREALRRGCLPASRLGFRAAARGRAPRRDHRAQCRVPRSRAGARGSCGCRNGAVASCSARRSPARPMPATARRWTCGLLSSTGCRPTTRGNFRRRPARLRQRPNCSIRSSAWCRRARH